MTGTDPTATISPVLSVSMIVRNEALRLPGFLNAVAGLADEVCVTDTGSTDNTRSIARDRGCVVQTFPWCNDFSAARNAALRPCTGAWILSLDADEVIAQEDHVALRQLTAGPRTRCYRFVTRNYTNDIGTSGFVCAKPGDPNCAGFSGWFPSSKVRLFPNVSGIAFEGAVHELIHVALSQQGIAACDTDIVVHHYPLLHQSASARAEKQALYLTLGKQKIAADPDDANARHELGDQYIDLGEYGLALESYKEAVRLDPANPIWLKDLGSTLLLLGQLPQALRALTLAARLNPNVEECWRNLGIAHAREENWPAAHDAFSRAHTLNAAHPENQRYLAIACQACGDRAGAIALLETLLAQFPDHEEARALYEQLVRLH